MRAYLEAAHGDGAGFVVTVLHPPEPGLGCTAVAACGVRVLDGDGRGANRREGAPCAGRCSGGPASSAHHQAQSWKFVVGPKNFFLGVVFCIND